MAAAVVSVGIALFWYFFAGIGAVIIGQLLAHPTHPFPIGIWLLVGPTWLSLPAWLAWTTGRRARVLSRLVGHSHAAAAHPPNRDIVRFAVLSLVLTAASYVLLALLYLAIVEGAN